MKIVVGVSGATGAPYAHRLLQFLAGPGREAGIETDVVFTKMGKVCWKDELGTEPSSLGLPLHGSHDFTAPFASGSARYHGMIVLPCSAGQLGRIAHGLSMDLVGRAADVMLKERRRLVLCVREAPYSLITLRNMVTVVEAGGVVMPCEPVFYSQPEGVGGLVDTVVSRALDQLGVDNELMNRWNGWSGR